jgi:CRISPR/Cas system endoribonuclease Cas6 (RAMP superfamily)
LLSQTAVERIGAPALNFHASSANTKSFFEDIEEVCSGVPLHCGLRLRTYRISKQHQNSKQIKISHKALKFKRTGIRLMIFLLAQKDYCMKGNNFTRLAL